MNWVGTEKSRNTAAENKKAVIGKKPLYVYDIYSRIRYKSTCLSLTCPNQYNRYGCFSKSLININQLKLMFQVNLR